MLTRRGLWLGLACLVARTAGAQASASGAPAATASAPAPASGAPEASFKPATGFIDDPLALRDDGAALAYLTTDGAGTSALHLAALPAGTTPEIVVEGLPGSVRALHFVGPDRVLVVSNNDDAETVTAQVFGPKGPAKEKLGPLIDIALSTVKGKPAAVGYARTEKKGVEHTVTAWSLATWKVVAKKTLKEDEEGRIADRHGAYKLLWWKDGFIRAAALKAGEYDKARDMRRPDRFAILDVLAGKLTGEHEIGDLLRFTQVALDHKKHGIDEVFVHLSDDHKQLLLTDGDDQHEVKLSRELFMYAPDSIAYQHLGDRVYVSANVDPMNPPAQERRKADPDDFDLHAVDRKSRAATVVLRLPGQGRGFGWRVGGGKVAVLHKSKGFDRGGVALEVYKLR